MVGQDEGRHEGPEDEDHDFDQNLPDLIGVLTGLKFDKTLT